MQFSFEFFAFTCVRKTFGPNEKRTGAVHIQSYESNGGTINDVRTGERMVDRVETE